MINSRIRFIFTCSRCLPKCLTVGLWLFHTLMERKSKGLSIVSTIMADLPPDIEMQVLLCTVGDQTKWRLLYHREKIGLFRVTLQRPFSVSFCIYDSPPSLFYVHCLRYRFSSSDSAKTLEERDLILTRNFGLDQKRAHPLFILPSLCLDRPWEQRDLYTIGKCWGHDIPSVFMICPKPNFSPTETQCSFFYLILGGHVCWFSCALRFLNWSFKMQQPKKKKKNVDFMVCRLR